MQVTCRHPKDEQWPGEDQRVYVMSLQKWKLSPSSKERCGRLLDTVVDNGNGQEDTHMAVKLIFFFLTVSYDSINYALGEFLI